MTSAVVIGRNGGSTHPDFQSAGHGFCRAIFAPIAFARARGRLGDGLATRGCGALNSGQPAPINFLGLGRALQPSEQSPRGLTQTFHLQSSFPNASACHEQSDTKERQGVGKRPQELVRQGQGDE